MQTDGFLLKKLVGLVTKKKNKHGHKEINAYKKIPYYYVSNLETSKVKELIFACKLSKNY